ncbi:translation initiation factor IF-2 [Hirschia maritima]|uniref:translation initiation factor IF-2 n=1 Tax=Hirschia maritima TaxID=1121961 RepID=UPI00037BA2E8|nr:translation initiation factor IF-2 [Hirschia maritima]
MSDTKDAQNNNNPKANGKPSGRKPLSVAGGSGGGTVKQSFSHGRSKQVVVETKKKKRVVVPNKSNRPGGAHNSKGGKPVSAAAAAAKKLGLSEEELRARQTALAQRKAAEEKRKAERDALETAQRQRAEKAKSLEAQAKERVEADERRKAEEVAKKQADIEAKQAAAEAAKQAAADKKSAAKDAEMAKRTAAPNPKRERRITKPDKPSSKPKEIQAEGPPPEPDSLSELGGRIKKARPAAEEQPDRNKQAPSSRRGQPKRRQGKLTITAALGEDEDRQRSLASYNRAKQKERERRQAMGKKEVEKQSREVVVPETITVQELANRMKERVADVVKFMMQQGEMIRGIDTLDVDTAELIVEEFGHTIKRVSESDVEIGLEGAEDDAADLKDRPPVVTIMGHVDHGKTSLLDALRQTDVVGGEAGGITQHIGAYQVKLKSGQKIAFLDTPGHAAFSAMRARGANVTDIVVVVVAADDGVMPQTIEAIKHAKAAEAPMIIAVNKCDKPDVDPMKVLTELLQHDVQVEAMGGDVQAINVSALKKTGLDELTEAISMQAEILELKANPDREADGIVIESKLDKGRGPVATVIVQRGTLKRGDIVVAGGQWGKIRALVNERGQQMKEAGPTVPAEVLGLDGPPSPGDQFVVVDSEARAREITEYRQRRQKDKAASAPGARASLEHMLARLKDGTVTEQAKEAQLVVKADVQGTIEAITHSLDTLSTEEVKARVVYGAVGGISESDILLAKASQAPIIAFNVRANKQALALAEKEGVEIRYYSIIYQLIDDVKATLSGMLAPERRETFIGYAKVLQVFNISKLGKVAGCLITEGVVKRGCGVRLLREDIVIHDGELSTLKRFKDEVSEVQSGMECGMGFVGYQDLKPDDVIECFEVEMIERSLD